MENQTKRQIELREEMKERLKVIQEKNPLKSITEILDEMQESNNTQGAMDMLILTYALTEETERLYKDYTNISNTDKNNSQD